MKMKLVGGVLVLILLVVLAYTVMQDNPDPLAYQRDAEIRIVVEGEREHTVDFDMIMDVKEHQFTVDRQDDDHTYTGVLIGTILEAVDADVQGAEQFVAKATDGYTVAIPASEFVGGDTVFLVYKINDAPLSPAGEGGSGPYRLVVKDDEFGQRWVKHLAEILVR